jgi:hypothetical protein
MIGEMNNWEGSCLGIIEIRPWYLPELTEEKYDKSEASEHRDIGVISGFRRDVDAM